jgi:hypothetical protein
MNRDDLTDPLTDALHSVGVRASAEAIRALIHHAIQSHLGPVETPNSWSSSSTANASAATSNAGPSPRYSAT